MRTLCAHASVFHIHSHTGDLQSIQPLPQGLYNSWQYNGNRGEIYAVLLEYAQSIGVEVRFGQNVGEYYELETGSDGGEGGRAGVTVNGERIEADVVVGADGVKSAARKLVLVSVPRRCSFSTGLVAWHLMCGSRTPPSTCLLSPIATLQ